MESSPQSSFALSPLKGLARPQAERLVWWVLLASVLLTMAFIRLRLLDFPLERDEGEYAYAGQLILQGVPPYQECYNMKWPGTYAAYAAIMAVFGETPAGIHLGLLLVNLASAMLVFFIGRRIGGEVMGCVAAGVQALLSVNPSVLGLAGHATHFVVLFALAGIWTLMAPWEDLRWGRCLSAGGLFGLACIMKQPGAVFGLFAAIWLLWRGLVEQESPGRNPRAIVKRLGFLAAGGIAALSLMAGALAAAGVFGRFWHWTVEYARAYVEASTLSEGLGRLALAMDTLWAAALCLWILAGLGAVLLWWEPALRRWRFFLFVFAAFSFAGVCPGYYFRHHYFLLLLPAVSLFCGAAGCAWARLAARFLHFLGRMEGTKNALAFEWVRRPGFSMWARGTFGALFLAAAGQSLLASRNVLFRLAPERAYRAIYYFNPFPESVKIARHIAERCPPGARIAVLGSEPEIYFYSHLRAATGYIYTYPLMESQPFAAEMQREMIQEIERAQPEYLVYALVKDSWLRREKSDSTIFDWAQRYCREQMELDGVVEMLPGFVSESRWNMAGRDFTPRSDCWLAIYRRKVKSPPVTIHL